MPNIFSPASSISFESSTVARAERETILACLAKIRRRLFVVRLTEQLAGALAWGAGIAVTAAGARLLRERFVGGAVLVAALPIVPAVWLWLKAGRQRNIILTPIMLRIAAVLTAAVAVTAITLMLIPAGAAVSLWQLAVGVVAIFVAAAATSVRPVTLRSAAIFVDHQAGLEERVATALEMLETPCDTPLEAAFREPVIEAALGACQQVKHAKVGYERLDRRVYALAATTALGAAAVCFLTPLPALARPAQQRFIVVAESAKRLSDVLKEIEEKKLPNDTATAEKIKPLQAKLSQLNKGDVGPIEAGALLEEAKSQLQKEKDVMGASDKVLEALKAMEQTQQIAAATDPAKDARMQQAAGDAGAGANQQKATEGIEKATQDLANKMKGGGMSDADKKKLAEGLKDAADKAGGDSQLQRDLENAASAATKGDANGVAKNMQAAAERMGQQRADQQMSQSAIDRTMSEIDRMEHSGMTGSEQMSQNNKGGQEESGQGEQGGRGSQGNPGDKEGPQANGQNGGNEGQPQNGEGQGQGDGAQANGNTPAGSQQGEGTGSQQARGSGSTNFEQKGGSGDQKAGGELGGRGTFVKIYDQVQTKTSGSQEKVGGQINPLGTASGTSKVMGLADKTDSSIRSYSQELSGAKQRAMDDLSKGEIPPQYQEMVREFFSPPEGKKPG